MKGKFLVDIEMSSAGMSSLKSVKPKSLTLLCPLCGVRSQITIKDYISDSFSKFDIFGRCLDCNGALLIKTRFEFFNDYTNQGEIVAVYPENNNIEIPKGVPEKYHQDYTEAKKVLAITPTATALLCRRILQRIIRDEIVNRNVVDDFLAKVKNKYGNKNKRPNLFDEIDYFVNDLNIGSLGMKEQIKNNLELIRLLGNIGAHPEPFNEENSEECKSISFDEAELILEILDSLLYSLFAQPFRINEITKRINPPKD